MDPAPTAGPSSPARERARWFDPFAGFNLALPEIPIHAFAAERERALAGRDGGEIALDLAPRLGLATPATTPAMLARYVRVAAGATRSVRCEATTFVLQALEGDGELIGVDGGALAFVAGDCVVAPGGADLALRSAGGCLVVTITDEPLLALLGVAAPRAPRFAAAHFPLAETRRRLDALYAHPRVAELPGTGVFLANAALGHVASPALTAVVNSLRPHETQPAHRHNAAAITVVLDAERCWSAVAGTRVDWQRSAVFVTPPALLHAHRNDGERTALVLTVQDSGLHYHLRTMGFSDR